MRKKNRKITAGGNIGKTPDQTIILTQPKRGGLDISYYMTAIRNAEMIDRPMRVKLLDLYEDILMDSHLQSVLRKQKASVLMTPIQFQRDGLVDEAIQEHIDSPWFGDLLEDIIEDEWKGVGGSLFQFYRDKNWINYDLIPRKHVDALNRVIMRNQTDFTGQSWDEFDDLLYVGNPRQIGALAEIAFWVIIKRNDVGDWAQFAEIFGQPMREGTYDAWDDNARQKLIKDIMALGSSPVFIHPEGTKINLIESSQKGSTCDVYERLATFCNSEISKRVLGSTLTTEVGDKGTQALGTVHQEGEQDITFFVKRRLLNILNYDVTETFTNLGINTTNGKFSFVPPKKKDLTAKIEIDCKLKNQIGLPIDDDYFYEEYGIPKPDNYNQIKKEQAEKKAALQLAKPVDLNNPVRDPEPVDTNKNKKPGEKPEEKEKSFKNWVKNFFVPAPGKKGALKW